MADRADRERDRAPEDRRTLGARLAEEALERTNRRTENLRQEAATAARPRFREPVSDPVALATIGRPPAYEHEYVPQRIPTDSGIMLYHYSAERVPSKLNEDKLTHEYKLVWRHRMIFDPFSPAYITTPLDHMMRLRYNNEMRRIQELQRLDRLGSIMHQESADPQSVISHLADGVKEMVAKRFGDPRT